MKRLMFIAAVCVAWCLYSCKTHKMVTATDQSSTIYLVDTTKLAGDTVSHKANTIDTTKTAAAFEGRNVIEFVDGGGKVNINPDGNITLEGVKNIKGQHKGNIEQDKGVSQQVEDTAGHHEQANGIQAEQNDQQKRTEEKTPAQKWYDTMFARIGLGVCIAALMWLLFLYLKTLLSTKNGRG